MSDYDGWDWDEPEPRWETCSCEYGGFYNAAKYSGCYECFLERRSEYDSCIYCGRWHSPRYETCFACRAIPGREEAASSLRQMVLTRDGFECQECGSRQALQVDHVIPCAKGGNARPWNLLTRCATCNRRKGATWFWGCRYEPDRRRLLEAYFMPLRQYLNEEERAALRLEVEEWRREHPARIGA